MECGEGVGGLLVTTTAGNERLISPICGGSDVFRWPMFVRQVGSSRPNDKVIANVAELKDHRSVRRTDIRRGAM